jgi:hypothetical protein
MANWLIAQSTGLCTDMEMFQFLLYFHFSTLEYIVLRIHNVNAALLLVCPNFLWNFPKIYYYLGEK